VLSGVTGGIISAWHWKCLSAAAGNHGCAFALAAEQALFALEDAVQEMWGPGALPFNTK